MSRRAWSGALLIPLFMVAGCQFDLGFPLPSNLELAFNVPGEQPAVLDIAGGPVFQERAVFDSIPDRTGHHAATVTAFGDGELLAAWYSYRGPGELDESAIYTSRRPAGSLTWTDPLLHLDQPAGLGNPVLYGEGGEVWMFHAVAPFGWSTGHVEAQRSHDRGLTWTQSRVIDGPMGSNVRNPPLRTGEGELLLPAYDDLLLRSLFFASADGEQWTLRSATWTEPPHQNIQPAVVRLGSGRLVAVMRNAGGGWLWAAASDDSGRSWSRPRDGGFPNPASAAAMVRLASGRLLLIFNDSATERRPLSAALSPDEGRTWTAPKNIADGASTYSYPAAAQTPDGLIHVLYSLDRVSIRHVMMDEAWIAGP